MRKAKSNLLYKQINKMSSNYIYNETLGGTIDGINVVFTKLNNISNIEEVYLGWAAYRDISFTVGTNVITFADAPPIGAEQPTVDYFDETVVPTAPSSLITFGDIIDDTFVKIGTKRTSKVYLENQIKRQINKGYKRIKNIKAYKDKILQYTFNKAKDQEAIGFSATTVVTVNEDFVPASGAILIGDTSFATYSTYNDGVFGASAWYTYNSGDRVSVGYKLPNGVKRPSEVILDRIVLTYKDNREFVVSPSNFNYTIFQDVNGDEFIFLPFKADEAIITVKYVPEFDIFENDDSVINIIYEYSDVLSLYAAYNVLLLREDDRWQAFKVEYMEEKDRLKAFKARQVEWVNNRIKTQPLIGSRRVARTVRFSADVTGL